MKSGQLACSTCHQEHHGKDFNIAHLSEQQCQVCHSVQFASLANGHPEFASYPYQRRTRIYFDHASHLQEHFPAAKEKAPTSCQACHVPAVSGGKMVVNNFEQSCSACHADNIRKSSPVAFFRVPGIDVGSLSKAGISIGQWPKDADDKITPFMELLLGSDTPGGQALAALKGKDLLDLSGASREQLAAAGKLAWAVKELLFDFEVEGQPFLLKRLQERLSPGQNAVQLAALTGGFRALASSLRAKNGCLICFEKFPTTVAAFYLRHPLRPPRERHQRRCPPKKPSSHQPIAIFWETPNPRLDQLLQASQRKRRLLAMTSWEVTHRLAHRLLLPNCGVTGKL